LDRRVLGVVAVLAMSTAMLLGWLMMPRVEPMADPAAAPAPKVEVAAAPRPRAQVPAPQRVAPGQMEATDRPTKPYERSPGVVGGQPHVLPHQQEQTAEQAAEYRCRALGQQSMLIDKLIIIASGGAVDDEQKTIMASRVADMSTRVYDEGESLWNGDLNCEGISDVNLGPAANFLARAREEMDLSDEGLAEIDQALAVLDTVEWPEDELQ